MVEFLNLIAAQSGIPIAILMLLLVWTLVWKAFALWKSARLNQPIWFVSLLIINTLGILEILYYYIFSEIKNKKSGRRKR